MVKAGDVVKVRVTEVDVPRKRIGLTMKSDGGASAKDAQRERGAPPPPKTRTPAQMSSAPKADGGNAFADALKGKFGR